MWVHIPSSSEGLKLSRKQMVTSGKKTRLLSLWVSPGITLRKLVRNATLDIVDGMAQLVDVLFITPAQR